MVIYSCGQAMVSTRSSSLYPYGISQPMVKRQRSLHHSITKYWQPCRHSSLMGLSAIGSHYKRMLISATIWHEQTCSPCATYRSSQVGACSSEMRTASTT